MKQTQNIRCNDCGEAFSTEIITMIDVNLNPELKESVISGELFLKECPHCGKKQLVKYPLIYIDKAEKLLLCLSDTSLKIENLEGMTGRIVPDVGSLIEKIKIFDAGLDDLVIEMCKFVTLQELGKDLALKYLRTEGAEGDIILAYPENAQMQMLAIGLNVYEDCRGILQRNPSITQAASGGLVRIDQQWLKNFFV